MYLLDTNHCSQLLGGHPSITRRLSELGDVPISTCVIVRGELIFMAHKSRESAVNLQRIQGFLADIQVYSIDSETADIYGKLKAAVLAYFGPKEKAKRSKTKTEKLGFTENDLWIAAIAKRHGLTIVSADSDFERMKEVGDLVIEKWWSLDQR